MNTWWIAFKEIKQQLRDRRTFWLMLAFPIALMLVLGFALNDAFGTGTEVGEIKVLYTTGNEENALESAFAGFAREAEQSGVTFETLPAGTDGREQVEEGPYAAYIELENGEIGFYGSSSLTIESQIVQGMLSVFVDRYDAAVAIASTMPNQAEAFVAEAGHASEYIKETSLGADRKPGSMDYYAVAMAVMIATWSALSAGSLIRRETVNGTMYRLAASPVRKGEMLAGKVMGSIVTNGICVILLVFISKYAFNAYWGPHIGLALAVLLTEVIMAVSFGLAAGYILNGKNGSSGFIMLIVQLAAFFGGSYCPMGDAEAGAMSTVVGLSPIRWANQALTGLIYENSISAAWNVMALNMLLAVLFLAVSAVITQRKEGI